MVTEKTLFAHDVKTYGLPTAQKKSKKRDVHRLVWKHRPETCKNCSTTLFCSVCSLGEWIFDDLGGS